MSGLLGLPLHSPPLFSQAWSPGLAYFLGLLVMIACGLIPLGLYLWEDSRARIEGSLTFFFARHLRGTPAWGTYRLNSLQDIFGTMKVI